MKPNAKQNDCIFIIKNINLIYFQENTCTLGNLVSEFAFMLADFENGELITKEHISKNVWGDKVFVSDDSIYQVISQLRKALNSLGASGKIINVKKRGFYLSGLQFIRQDRL